MIQNMQKKTYPGEKFTNISDEDCILLEFPNEVSDDEKPLISIGYKDWLRSAYKKDIGCCIKEEKIVEVYWPVKLQVCVAKKLKAKLKDATFKLTSARILSEGGE